jgi:hypothetical protein
MTGPEHYGNAESDLDNAARADDKGHHEDAMFWLAAAQVHATLALAAATALCGTDPDGSSYTGDMNAWYRTAGVKPTKADEAAE